MARVPVLVPNTMLGSGNIWCRNYRSVAMKRSEVKLRLSNLVPRVRIGSIVKPSTSNPAARTRGEVQISGLKTII